MVLREHEGLSEHEKRVWVSTMGLSQHDGLSEHDKSELVREFSPMCQDIVDGHFTITFVFGSQVPNSWASVPQHLGVRPAMTQRGQENGAQSVRKKLSR